MIAAVAFSALVASSSNVAKVDITQLRCSAAVTVVPDTRPFCSSLTVYPKNRGYRSITLFPNLDLEVDTYDPRWDVRSGYQP